MNQPSTKPYLIRAIYEWCCECGYTPMLFVSVDIKKSNNLPKENIKDGEIIFNVNQNAVRNLNIGNDIISFSARFNGVVKEISFPTETVSGIFAREINQGIAFPDVSSENKEKNEDAESVEDSPSRALATEGSKKGKTSLRIVK